MFNFGENYDGFGENHDVNGESPFRNLFSFANFLSQERDPDNSQSVVLNCQGVNSDHLVIMMFNSQFGLSKYLKDQPPALIIF